MKDRTIIMIIVLMLLIGLYIAKKDQKGLAETAYN